ncbi:MAG: hypothetical protein OXC02_11120, partial [Rhodobacteraceae bacterium]|nr:hypothetical protein [Paracoccaceae bacterium]
MRQLHLWLLRRRVLTIATPPLMRFFNPIIALLIGALLQFITAPAHSQVSTKTYALTPSVTAEEGENAELTVTLGEAAPSDGLLFNVNYDYSSGSATSADTGTTPTTVRVLPSATSATISVPIFLDRRIVDNGETFTVTITPASGVTGWSVTAGKTATSTVTIIDNAASITFPQATYRFTEVHPLQTNQRLWPAIVSVDWMALSNVGLSRIDVEWRMNGILLTREDIDDFDRPSTGFNVFPFERCRSLSLGRCGHGSEESPVVEQTHNVASQIVNDQLVEGDETYIVTLKPPDGWPEPTIASATITVIDDDVASARIAFGNSATGTSSYNVSVAENSGTLNVLVTVSHLPESQTTFDVEVLTTGTADEETDYRIGTQSVTFGPTDSKTKTLSVEILDDTNFEPGETIQLRIAAADKPVDDLGDYYKRHA